MSALTYDGELHLHCRKCGVDVVPVLYSKGPHIQADCPHCDQYLKFVPKVEPWLSLVPSTIIKPSAIAERLLFEGAS